MTVEESDNCPFLTCIYYSIGKSFIMKTHTLCNSIISHDHNTSDID